MMENEKGTILSDDPFFNEKFIKSVKLKSITGTISSKKELGTISNTGRKQAFLFNKNGSLKGFIRQEKTGTQVLFFMSMMSHQT